MLESVRLPSPQPSPRGRGGKGRVSCALGKPHATATSLARRGMLARHGACDRDGNAL